MDLHHREWKERSRIGSVKRQQNLGVSDSEKGQLATALRHNRAGGEEKINGRDRRVYLQPRLFAGMRGRGGSATEECRPI